MTPEQIRHASDVIINAAKTIKSQREVIASLKDRVSAMEAGMEILAKYIEAVDRHNRECADTCNEGANCGYASYLTRTGRRCSSCPAGFKVDIMPTKGRA